MCEGRAEGRRKDLAEPSIDGDTAGRGSEALARRIAPADALRNVDLFSVSSCFEVLMLCLWCVLGDYSVAREGRRWRVIDSCQRGMEEWKNRVRETETGRKRHTNTHIASETVKSLQRLSCCD